VFIAQHELNVYIQLTFGTAWGKFFPSTSVLPEAIIPPVLHTHQYLHVLLLERQTGETWEPSCSFGCGGALCRKELSLTVPWFRRLVACLSSWSSYFDCSSDHVRFLVDIVVLGEVFVRVRPFSPVSIIPALLRGYLHLTLVLTRTNGRILVTIQKAILFRQSGSLDRTVCLLCRRGVIHRIFCSGCVTFN
jgi:hypothetical protein